MDSPGQGFKVTCVGSLILGADGMVKSVNQTALRWLGYAAGDVLGRPLHAFLGAGGQFFLQSQILPMLTLKGELEEVYLRLKTKDGQLVPVLVNAAKFTEGQAVSTEFSFLRIPQRGRLEDELLQAKKLAEQASDSKTKFLGMMSHELRTPLGAIGLNNQLLLSGDFGAMTPGQKELLASSESCVRDVTILIDDILGFAQMRGASVEVTSENLALGLALDRAARAIQHRFQNAGIAFLNEKPRENLRAQYDPDRVQQILLNLLNNALKFTPKGGTISIRALIEANEAMIEVTDTGAGIPVDQLSRIFEPFVQLHSAIETTEKKGIGLGLAICRELAIAMGGAMRVRSELGKGSTFTLALPLTQA